MPDALLLDGREFSFVPPKIPLPETGSVWAYRKHPERLYTVLHVANIAHMSKFHPPVVVYCTTDFPDRIWTRSLALFEQDFVLVTHSDRNPHHG